MMPVHPAPTRPLLAPPPQPTPRPLARLAAAAASLALLASPPPADASLLSFPASRLNNTYYLVRAGESVADAAGRARSSPATKESSAAALSPAGRDQVATITLPAVLESGACSSGCWIYYSTTTASAQVARAIAAASGVGVSRLQPEYVFLDARGVGGLEGGQLPVVLEELAAGDATSPDWRPPMGSDGTPPDSIASTLARVAQSVSGAESKYSGETVLLVAPDAVPLGALQAAIEGADLRTAAALAPPPGGVARLRLAPAVTPE